MKKYKKKFFQGLSVILSIITIIGVIPFYAFAVKSTINPFDNFEPNNDLPSIEGEIIEKRTAYSKVYSTDDGGYYTIISENPIHIEDENGKFQNIEEPTNNLSTEEEISEYIDDISKLYDSAENSVSTYSVGPTETDTYVYDSPCLIKCFGASGVDVSGQYLVQGSGKGNKSVFIKPNIEQNNFLITSAKISADAIGLGATANNYIIAKEVVTGWNSETTSQPNVLTNYFDGSTVVKSSTTTACSWDITHLMNCWNVGLKNNNGIALTTSFRNCSVKLQNICFSFYYREIDELDSSFTYESIDMGIAGSVHINHYSCIPTLVHEDIGIEGEKSPVFISHIYEALGSSTINPYGQKFRINYESTLQYVGYNSYVWKTIDGQTKVFTYSDENNGLKNYTCKDTKNNKEFVLSVSKDVLTNQYNYVNYNNISIKEITSEITYLFETHSDFGYLIEIDDGSANHNKLLINYDLYDETENLYKSNDIQTITDGVGRQYHFNYESDGSSSYLSSIEVFNASGDNIRVGEASQSENFTIGYNYETDTVGNKYLTYINHVGESSAVAYTYDEMHRISTISNGKKKLILTYAAEDSNRISSYKTILFNNQTEVLLDEITIDSSLIYKRIFTNQDGKTCVINYDRGYNTVYYKDFDDHILLGVSENGATTYMPELDICSNLIQNADFEEIDVSGAPSAWTIEGDTEATSSTEHSNGLNVEIRGNYYDYARISQKIDSSSEDGFKAGKSYAYGGLGRVTRALPPNGSHTFGIYIFNALETENNEIIPNECISFFNFDETIYNSWQRKMSYFTLTEDTPALFIYLCFDYNYNQVPAYFDDIQLYEFTPPEDGETIDPYAYSWNGNNSCTSKKQYGAGEQSSQYLETIQQYDDNCSSNYLSVLENERGISTYYQYDTNNGRLKSVASGIEANKKYFEYTASGLLSSVKQTVTNIITGNTVEMKTEYDYINGQLSSVTHNGFSYNLSYDVFGNVTDIKVSTSETPLVSTTYENARNQQVDTITYSNGCVIDYTYDATNSEQIAQIDYKNADGTIYKSYLYSYNENGDLTAIVDNKAKVKIAYSDNSYSYILLENEKETVLYHSYVADDGKIVETFNQMDMVATTVSNSPHNFESTDTGTISKSSQILTRTEEKQDTTIPITYTYEKENYTDKFNRLQSKKLVAKYQEGSDISLVESEDSYSYKSLGDRQTTLLSDYRTKKAIGVKNDSGELITDGNGNVVKTTGIDITFSYAYDAAGNITQIILKDNLSNESFLYGSYKYDQANQLVFEYSPTKSCCVKYSYDAGGNIICKRMYDAEAYDYDTNDTYADASYEDLIFTYDNNFTDRLSSVGGEPIVYDKLNNPINYFPANGFFEWNGRLLTAFESNEEGERYEYEYDANGLRTRKVVYSKKLIDGTTDQYTYEKENSFEYIWKDGILEGFSMTNPTNPYSVFINIIYDESGVAQGYVGLSGTPYYFVRDGLGNVTSVIGGNEDVCVNISYDAWGNPEFPKAQDGIEHLGDNLVMAFITMFNPFKYKGYLYDYETGLYYCQSRYYSPVWSRFLNMDDTSILNLTQGETLGANLYAYCYNNPINNIDPNGYLTISRWALALGLDVILTLVVPYFSGPLDIFGRGLKALANKKNFTLVWEKLLYGAVPKFKGLFSRGFTGIRTAIWRVTGSWISNSTTSLIGANITNFVRLFRSSGWNKAWDIASCFFSAGSMIAGLLDYLDGRFDGKCKVW